MPTLIFFSNEKICQLSPLNTYNSKKKSGVFMICSYMPMLKLLFQEPKSPKSRTWHNFQGHFGRRIPTFMTGYQILRKNQRAILHCAPRLLILHGWECCLLITHDCLPVQSFHNRAVNFRVVTKGHISRYSSLNVRKHFFFTGDGLAGMQSAVSAMLSLTQETFLHMVRWFWSSVWLAALQMRCSLWENLEKLLLLRVFVHAQSTSKDKSAYPSFAHMQSVK